MFRLSPITKRTTASLLLVVFLHLLAKQCLCLAMGVPVGNAQAVAAKSTAPDPHACCKKLGKEQKSRSTKPMPASEKPDDCCKHKSVVLKSVDAPTGKQLDAPALLSLPPAQSFTFARFVAWDASAPVTLVPPQHLPPKIPDLRVFLRSLTV
ncbi:hypothetical protein GCM10023185_00590 [Hymenobacter saemangeumensis]|uniref:Uncharacterized protein n=1 Tax=Hymenobacter saemangeumensis TaxID=1084522 RepID=A0ABP8HWX7_9BACT